MKLNNLNLRITAKTLICCSIFVGAHAHAAYEIDNGNQSVIIGSAMSTNEVYVGRYTSENSLTITNGSSTAGSVYVGTVEPSGNNTLLVTGSNSVLLATTELSVGEGGTGNTLIVDDRAWIVVGEEDSGTQNSISAGGIMVGNTNGTAVLSFGNGSTGQAENLCIGVDEADSGLVSLSGEETQLNIADGLYLGYAGSNSTLTLSDGASLTVSNQLQVGSATGSNNVMNINDGGKATILGTVNIDANNAINITNGGHLAVSGDFDLGTAASDGFNLSSGAKLETGGTLTADKLDSGFHVILNGELGAGSAGWDTGEKEMRVGQTSSGNTLTLKGGASVVAAQSTAHIGEESTSHDNILTISGSGTTFTSSEKLFVGEAGDRNNLVVEDGGQATITTDLTIGQTSAAQDNQVTVSGSNTTVSIFNDLIIGNLGNRNTLTLQGGNTTISNNLVVGLAGQNNRYVQTGGTNTVLGGFLVGETTDSGGATTIGETDTTGNLGSVGENAILNIEQNLTVGKEGGGSILLIHDGGSVFVSGDTVIGEASEDNYIFLQPDDPDSRFNITGDLIVGKEGGNNRFAIYGGTANIDGSLYLSSSTNQPVQKNYIHLETTNAELNVAKAIYIGASNSVNTLDLVLGAKASAKDLFVGTYAGVSNNVVTISGNDSLLYVSNNLAIGSNTGSNNTVTVEDGGILFVSAGSNIDIGSATSNLNNRLNINSEGTLQTLDWNFGTISSNLFLNTGSTLEVGGSLTGTNLVDSGIEIALNSGLSASNAIWNSGSDTLYVGYETSDNALTVFGEGSVISGNDLIIGFETNSHNNTVTVYGNNSTLAVANDLTVGLNGNGNSLTITNGATVTVTNDAWIGLASSGNWIAARGTNSSLRIEGDVFVGSSDLNSSENQLGAYDTATISVGGSLTVTDGDLIIDYNSQVHVTENYQQDKLASLYVTLSTNSITTNLIVAGTANFAKDSTIVVRGDGTIPEQLVDEEGITNQVGRTIVDAGDLHIADQEATTALLHSSINFQTNALFGFDYFVVNDSIYLDNFTKRTLADAGDLNGMLADVSTEIEAMADASNTLSQAMLNTFQDGMTGEEIDQAMENFYGEKESSISMNNIINQGLGGFASELTGRSDNTRERMGAASAAINWNKPSGAAGPHTQEQELRGWISGYGSWGKKDSDNGYESYDSTLNGFIIGGDLSISKNLLIGIAGGASSGSTDGDYSKTADSDTTYGAVYASTGTKDWFLDGSVIYGSSSVDQNQGYLFDTKASYDSRNLAFYLGGGKELIGQYLILTPQVSALINYYDQDSYNEESNDAVARSVDGFSDVYLQSSVGCNLGAYMGIGDITFKPEIRIHWLHEFNAGEQSLSYGLIGGSGSPYTMKLQAPEEDILLLGAGVSAKISESLEFCVDVDTQQAASYSDYTVLGSLRYLF